MPNKKVCQKKNWHEKTFGMKYASKKSLKQKTYHVSFWHGKTFPVKQLKVA